MNTSEYHEPASAVERSRGELGLFHLARRQYVEALDALLHSSDAYWLDAAYIAERVATVEELKRYVDHHWTPPNAPPAISPLSLDQEKRSAQNASFDENDTGTRIRYLLARRLARANRLNEARAYLPPKWLPLFDTLLAAHNDSSDPNLSQNRQAQALLQAARITRRYGLELLGTEGGPDWRIHNGSFQAGVTVADRTGTNVLAATSEELQRAADHAAQPDRRWHYRHTAAVLARQAGLLLRDAPLPRLTLSQRADILFDAAQFTVDHDISFIPSPFETVPEDKKGTPEGLWLAGYTAGALAWEAAGLLPDHANETARVLCQGGSWIKFDPGAADLLYKTLVRRCRKTAIGTEADRLRWFPRIDTEGNLLTAETSQR